MKLFKKILFAILLCAFVFFLIQFIFGIYTRYVAKEDYDSSKDIAKLPEITLPRQTASSPETTEAPDTEPTPDTTSSPPPEALPNDDIALTLLLETDIASLKAVNPDVVGWMIIPETNISFPLVQGEDNEHYLYHTWTGKWSWSGSIYLDYHVSPDLSDYNTVIYGHNMGGGEMFSDLLNYKDQSFYNDHPSVYIVTEGMVRRYDIFSAYEADLENGKTFTIGQNTPEKKAQYLEYCKELSEIECNEPTDGVDVITLATCTETGIYDYKTRWVVQACLSYAIKSVHETE